MQKKTATLSRGRFKFVQKKHQSGHIRNILMAATTLAAFVHWIEVVWVVVSFYKLIFNNQDHRIILAAPERACFDVGNLGKVTVKYLHLISSMRKPRKGLLQFQETAGASQHPEPLRGFPLYGVNVII